MDVGGGVVDGDMCECELQEASVSGSAGPAKLSTGALWVANLRFRPHGYQLRYHNGCHHVDRIGCMQRTSTLPIIQKTWTLPPDCES
eukprot:scaffold1211_cov169-Amphora_coffeaeformis.AAC.31